MIAFSKAPLPPTTASDLSDLQATVLAVGKYRDQVAAGKRLFSEKNKKTNPIFKIVREHLHNLGGITRRCAYCEDSLQDEVEHIAPKDLYPETVFVWENYVYACGPCNGGHKRAQWKVFPATGGMSCDVTRKQNTKNITYLILPPAVIGSPVFINPRLDDPMYFLQLDLVGGTGCYVVRGGLTPNEAERADYTLTTLGLNSRPGLPEGRKNAFVSLRDTLLSYDHAKATGIPVTTSQQQQRIEAIKTTGHRTVWKEIIRQKIALGMDAVFIRNPEALGW